MYGILIIYVIVYSKCDHPGCEFILPRSLVHPTTCQVQGAALDRPQTDGRMVGEKYSEDRDQAQAESDRV